MNAPLKQSQIQRNSSQPTTQAETPNRSQSAQSRGVSKTAPNSNSKLELLLVMEAKIRNAASLNELRFLLANETKKLIPSDQILLHRVNKNGDLRDIETVSSIATLDADAPILLWLNKVISEQLNSRNYAAQTFLIQVENAPGGVYPFPYVLHVPFIDRNNKFMGAFSFLKATPFNDNEIACSKRISDTTSHAMSAFKRYEFSVEKLTSKPVYLGGGILALLAMFVPVPLTILAPAKIIAHNAAIVTAPLQGVIEHIAVQPNQQVKKGDLLFTFNQIELQSAFDIAERNVAIADARYRRATQGAFKSADSKRDLAITKAEYLMAIAEKNNAATRLALSDITAKKSGIILFQSKEKWLGKPIVTGERIMRIADPKTIRFKVDVAAADSIILEDASDVNVFLDSAPLKPVSAIIEVRSYEAELSSQNTFVFPIMAKVVDISSNKANNNLRIGLRGTAQIYGKKEPLWFYLFRKPISAIRQLIGY